MTSKSAMLLSPGSLTVDQSPMPPSHSSEPKQEKEMDDKVVNISTSNEENTGTVNNYGDANMTRVAAPTSNANNKAGFATPSTKATSSRATDSRLPTVSKSSSVFDRLYKSDTVSSRTHRISSRAMLSPKVRSGLRNSHVTNVDQDLQVFARLSVSDTQSTKARRMSRTPHKIKHSALGSTSFSTPPPKMSTYQLMSSSGSVAAAPHTAPSKGHLSLATTRRMAARYEFSPHMKPVTKLYFISKFHPGVGLEVVDPISLGYTFFQAFCEYESGGMDAPTIAKEILVAFFKKDFPAGRHWELHEPTVGDKMVGKTAKEGTFYHVSMSATYDWDDAYRVANAKGVVRFRRAQKEIRIENYRYDLTGDP
jgi:hypothetical protein